MVDPFQIEAGEFGWVRLFTADIDAATLERINADRPDTQPKAAAIGDMLGIDWVDPMHVELFDVADLEGLGLAGYLVQGAGIPEAAVSAESDTLNTLFGIVLIVYSKAFEGQEYLLQLAPSIAFITQFEQEKQNVSFQPLPSSAPQSDTTAVSQSAPSPQRTVLQAIFTLPLVLIFVGVLIWLIFG